MLGWFILVWRATQRFSWFWGDVEQRRDGNRRDWTCCLWEIWQKKAQREECGLKDGDRVQLGWQGLQRGSEMQQEMQGNVVLEMGETSGEERGITEQELCDWCCTRWEHPRTGSLWGFMFAFLVPTRYLGRPMTIKAVDLLLLGLLLLLQSCQAAVM